MSHWAERDQFKGCALAVQYQMGAESLAARIGQLVYQAAELLRLACCLATERGVEVCAPVHDALLIEAPLAELPEQVRRTQATMEEASVVVLDGFRLRSDAKLRLLPTGTRMRRVRRCGSWSGR